MVWQEPAGSRAAFRSSAGSARLPHSISRRGWQSGAAGEHGAAGEVREGRGGETWSSGVLWQEGRDDLQGGGRGMAGLPGLCECWTCQLGGLPSPQLLFSGARLEGGHSHLRWPWEGGTAPTKAMCLQLSLAVLQPALPALGITVTPQLQPRFQIPVTCCKAGTSLGERGARPGNGCVLLQS